MKIESNKNWTTCLRLNTGDGSPRVFLLNSHFLGSVPFETPSFLFQNKRTKSLVAYGNLITNLVVCLLNNDIYSIALESKEQS